MAKAINITTITTTKPMMIQVSFDIPPKVPPGVGTGVGSVLPTGVKTAW
jgi:hypothetical protein